MVAMGRYGWLSAAGKGRKDRRPPRKNALCCRAIRGSRRQSQKRAAFEHLIAENSTSLINCPPGEIDSKLAQALGELGPPWASTEPM
jgi:hypothetical protein